MDKVSVTNADLLAVAALSARDSEYLCADVAAMIFPTASLPPSEEMIASVSVKLVGLVRSIELRLVNQQSEESGLPISWPLLSKSGFLREPELIDFVLARVAEDRFEDRIDIQSEHDHVTRLPAKLLEHADPHVADAAQSLLSADSLHRKSNRLAYHALRPELLHQLCWRVVAALEVENGARDPAIVDAAKALLGEYDENATARTAARKLTHFIGEDMQAQIFDPLQSGVHIFVAAVAAQMRLDHDHVLRLIETPSATPLSILLRGCGLDRHDAMSILYLAKGFSLTPREVALFDRIYAELTIEDAHAEAARWATARSQQLLGQMRA